jgi:DNA-binding NarL/FixJ family response regulator
MGIKQILQDVEAGVEVGEAADAREAMAKIRGGEWDLVLLDLRLPGRSGVDVLKEIKSEKPKLPVLILSTYPESQYAVRLIQAGAAGYLNKDAEEEEILAAVRKVVGGNRYISPVVADLLANHINKNLLVDDNIAPHEILSDREYQIFIDLASGMRPNEIAKKLQLSAKTVATHRTRILTKMGFSTNAELTLYANRRGLIL